MWLRPDSILKLGKVESPDRVGTSSSCPYSGKDEEERAGENVSKVIRESVIEMVTGGGGRLVSGRG
jgi:hypothetical protein